MPLTDAERRSFLDALDDSDRVTPDGWECKFLNSNMDRENFTAPQRASIDKMIKRYGNRLVW